jgi:arylsulfatase A
MRVGSACLIVVLANVFVSLAQAASADQPPNFVILFADDLGYGDLGCYGHPTIRTPNLDRMAAEGMRFTQFYCAAPVCTPSRAALMTGRLPIRTGMCSSKRGVLFPDSAGGLPAAEITLAQALKAGRYATACIGKWHLGHLPAYLPTRHGFDYYYGLPYSNDMGKGRPSRGVPLIRNEEIIEDPADLSTLTPRYTAEAIRFIGEHRKSPFLLYLPYTYPHVPLHASGQLWRRRPAGEGTGETPVPQEYDRSLRGLYGDVVEELDHSVGQILDTLRDTGLSERTLVLFTSDNGPWLTQSLRGGSAGLLRDGKGTTWDGGMREPGIAWWPGHIRPGVVNRELASTLDVFPTLCKLAGVERPADRVLDGFDLSPTLLGAGPSPRNVMFFYHGAELFAYRKGPYKIHLSTVDSGKPGAVRHDPPLLFNLNEDPSERFDIADKQPEVVADLLKDVAAHRASFQPPPSQLESRTTAATQSP